MQVYGNFGVGVLFLRLEALPIFLYSQRGCTAADAINEYAEVGMRLQFGALPPGDVMN